jgi:hypothetical protein
MKKRMIFPQNDEDANDSVLHWKKKHDEAVDKWVKLDSQMLKVMRESEEKDKQIAFLKDSHDAMRELAYKTGAQEERDECDRLKRENSILRSELKERLTSEWIVNYDMSEEVTEQAAEQYIVHAIAHNEGAE